MIFYIKFIFSLIILQFAGNTLYTSAIRSHANATVESGFGAISDGKKVILSWSTANDRSFDYFTIERSKDGVNFSSAVMIKGAGKISSLIDYTDIDYSPFSGISYYRLKETDYSGESYFSETVVVNYQVTKEGTLIPCTNKIPDESELKEIENKNVLVVMRDSKGQEFISKIHLTRDAENLYASDTKNLLNKGTYIVVASSFNRLCSQKLVVK